MKLSVIICTHNPRPDYLRRVLDAVKAQTLPKEQWELLVIDNASKESVAEKWDLSWHPHARHIREEEVGLTPARLRGIKESTGELLVLVDDDNALNVDYLEKILELEMHHPQIGAFGASVKGEFETSLPNWITPYLHGLVICELDRDYWSNLGGWSLASPYGAGLCVRRTIAEDYAQKAKITPLRKRLGRAGTSLGSGEDSDLSWCAIDAGMGTGRFRSLKLTHLIPRGRLTEEYIIRLFAGFAAAEEVFEALRPVSVAPKIPSWRRFVSFLFNYVCASKLKRKILRASIKARKEAKRMIATNNLSQQ